MPQSARWDTALLAALAAAMCFVRLGTGSLNDWDEAIYGEVARQYHAGASWLTPMWNGHPWFHKPPLVMWFTAVSFDIWGVGEGAVRFGSALCGIAGILILFWFTRRMFGRVVALLAALVLLSTPDYLAFSKMGMLDVPLTLCITLSLLFYWMGLTRRRWLAVAGAAFAVGFMIKGTAAVVAPLICMLHAGLFRDLRVLRSPWLWAGGGIALAIILPWHLVQYLRHGDAFFDAYLGYHVLARAGHALEGHDGTALFYLGVLVERQYPWFVLSFIAVPWCAVVAWKQRDRDLGLVVCWVAVIFVLYTAVATKISWYIMPAYPALAVCIAVYLARKVAARHHGRLIVGALLVVVAQVVATHGVLDLDHTRQQKALAEQARTLVPAGGTVYIDGVADPAVVFYCQRRVEPVARACGAYVCIVRGSARLGALRDRLPAGGLEILDARGDLHLVRVHGLSPSN